MNAILSRPRLLSRAAHAGATIYRREKDLARIMPRLFGKAGATVIPAIAAAEAACEAERKSGAANYSVSRHVSLLAALVAESATASA